MKLEELCTNDDLDGGLEGAASADNSDYPNLQKNLETYKKEAMKAVEEGDFEAADAAANAAATDIAKVDETGVDVPVVGESSGGWGYEAPCRRRGRRGSAERRWGRREPVPAGDLGLPTVEPSDGGRRCAVRPRPGSADRSAPGSAARYDRPLGELGDDPSDPFDHDTGYTDPVDDVDTTLSGIPPSEAPTDTVANYEEGYLPPAEVTGDEIPQDGHLDPLIGFE